MFARLNLKNANDKAVDIARKDLAAICRAVGVMSPKSSEELHDKPLMIKVKVRPASGEYDASNDVGGYKADEHGNATETRGRSGVHVASANLRVELVFVRDFQRHPGERPGNNRANQGDQAIGAH
mgnify:CR=1 FL=1